MTDFIVAAVWTIGVLGAGVIIGYLLRGPDLGGGATNKSTHTRRKSVTAVEESKSETNLKTSHVKLESKVIALTRKSSKSRSVQTEEPVTDEAQSVSSENSSTSSTKETTSTESKVVKETRTSAETGGKAQKEEEDFMNRDFKGIKVDWNHIDVTPVLSEPTEKKSLDSLKKGQDVGGSVSEVIPDKQTKNATVPDSASDEATSAIVTSETRDASSEQNIHKAEKVAEKIPEAAVQTDTKSESSSQSDSASVISRSSGSDNEQGSNMKGQVSVPTDTKSESSSQSESASTVSQSSGSDEEEQPKATLFRSESLLWKPMMLIRDHFDPEDTDNTAKDFNMPLKRVETLPMLRNEQGVLQSMVPIMPVDPKHDTVSESSVTVEQQPQISSRNSQEKLSKEEVVEKSSVSGSEQTQSEKKTEPSGPSVSEKVVETSGTKESENKQEDENTGKAKRPSKEVIEKESTADKSTQKITEDGESSSKSSDKLREDKQHKPLAKSESKSRVGPTGPKEGPTTTGSNYDLKSAFQIKKKRPKTNKPKK